MMTPVDDTRCVTTLWEAASQGDIDVAWNAVAALHWRGSKDVLDCAIVLTRSSDTAARARAADVLGQLGVPERTFPEESFSALLHLLGDEVPTVVCAAVYALQYVDQVRAAPHIIPFADHENGGIRQAVAFGLSGVDTPEALNTLLKLMSDRDARVRDWATFGIGQQSDVDADQIRATLLRALTDEDADVRYEGAIGLGLRRDNRAVGYLKLLLEEEPDDLFAREAAAKLLGLTGRRQTATADLLGALRRVT